MEPETDSAMRMSLFYVEKNRTLNVTKAGEYLGGLVLVAGTTVRKNHPAVANGLTSM